MLTHSTREAFKENIVIADKVGLLIDEIATASQEQSHGIGQINTAVANMDKVTQDAVANVEESASASEEMNAQAEQMKIFICDLMQVLNGSGNMKGKVDYESAKSVHVHEAKRPLVIDMMKEKTGKDLLLPMTKKGLKSKIVRPEDIIPLGEDKFKDF